MTIVEAKHSFVAAGNVRVRAGELYPADHPVPVRYGALFGDPDLASGPIVEAATAAPGEARATSRRRKRAVVTEDETKPVDVVTD